MFDEWKPAPVQPLRRLLAKRLGTFPHFLSSRLSSVTSLEYVRRNLALLDASSP